MYTCSAGHSSGACHKRVSECEAQSVLVGTAKKNVSQEYTLRISQSMVVLCIMEMDGKKLLVSGILGVLIWQHWREFIPRELLFSEKSKSIIQSNIELL